MTKGFSQIILLGIVAVLILTGIGSFLVFQEFQEKKMPSFEKTVRQKEPFEEVTSLTKPTPSPAPQSIQPALQPTAPPPSPAKAIIEKDKPPVLKNLGIKIEPWNKTTNMAGDILFENKNYPNNKIFTEFGYKIVNEFVGQLLPEIAFNIPVGTKAVSPIDGIITDLRFYEPSQDYLILIKTDKSSPWIVGFEHIYNNMHMKVGDRVFAGQEIAESSFSYGETEYATFEVNVWTAGQGIIKYCPYNFLEESLKPIYKEKINQLAKDWEEFTGQDVYKQENWVAPGCLLDKIIER